MAEVKQSECCRKFATEIPKHVSRKDVVHNFREFLYRTKYDALYILFHPLQYLVTLVYFDSKCHVQFIKEKVWKSCGSSDYELSEEFICLKEKGKILKCKSCTEHTFCNGLKETVMAYEYVVRYVKNRQTTAVSSEIDEKSVHVHWRPSGQGYPINVNLRSKIVTGKAFVVEVGVNDDFAFSVQQSKVSKNDDHCMKNFRPQINRDKISEHSQKTGGKFTNFETEPTSDKQRKDERPTNTINLNVCKNTDNEIEQKQEREGKQFEQSGDVIIATVTVGIITDNESEPQLVEDENQIESGKAIMGKCCKISSNTVRATLKPEKENEEAFDAEDSIIHNKENVNGERNEYEKRLFKQERELQIAKEKTKSIKMKQDTANKKDENYDVKSQEDQELLKKRKKPFRWKKKLTAFNGKLTTYLYRKKTDPLYIKLIHFFQKQLKTPKRYLTELLEQILNYDQSWNVEILAFPAKKSKSGRSAGRRSQDRQNQSSQQDRQNQSSQGAEGGPDHYSVQVSEAETDGLSLPSGDRVVTSTSSVFRPPTSTSGPSPTTNQLSVDAERNLLSRIRRQLPASRFSTPPQPARHPQYSDQPSRQRSYTNWPSSTGQDPARMAVYGLFYTGRFDLVRCFQCGIGLKDWSGTDEPLFEHIRHSGECPFLKDLLGQDLLNAYKENLRSNQVPATNPAGSSSGQASGRVRNPQYSDLQARIRSFLSWPASNLQRPEVLAEAGLFFTGTNDLCRCFNCDGGLQRWDSDDDPWIEHARWFPQCAYVRQIKGQDYIDMVQQAAAAAREEEDPIVFPPGQSREGPIEQRMEELSLQRRDPLSTPEALRVIGMGYSRKAVLLAIHEFSGRTLGARNDFTYEDLVGILKEREQRGEALPPDSPQDSTGVNLEVLAENMDPEELNRHLRGILKCMRCEVNDSNILFLPCTHHRMCEECAVEVTVCPICGRKVDDKIRTFMS